MVHVIVTGNEKGGAGKSTLAIHLAMALLRQNKSVGVLDLDIRQGTLSRYLQNRRDWAQRHSLKLPMPIQIHIPIYDDRDLDEREAKEKAVLEEALTELAADNDFLVIDVPGTDSYLSRLAHSYADTLVTPMNDSFIDFALLADVDPDKLDVVRPSHYATMVWDAKKERALAGLPPSDWVVLRNRLSALDARNKRRVGANLQKLSSRIGFRLLPGLTERVIYRELFPRGLTLIDMTDKLSQQKLSLSHVAARQELRDLLLGLELPGVDTVEF